MTNLKQLLEHNPLSMPLEPGQKRRKGYQYVPDLPIEEAPLPLKRERKKVQYNDYINPVKPVRKSPPRKRKKSKKTKPLKKQKLDSLSFAASNGNNNNNETGHVLQSLNDKKKELEENLRSINAMLAGLEHKKVESETEDDIIQEKLETKIIDSKEERGDVLNNNNINNNDDDNTILTTETSAREAMVLDNENVDQQNTSSNLEVKEEIPDSGVNTEENSPSFLDDESEQNSSNADVETTSEPAQDETELPLTTEIPTGKTVVRKTKKAKRRRSSEKKKKSKPSDPNKQPRRVTRSVEILSTNELAAQNNATFLKILNTLIKHKFSFPFLQPVDPVALQIPDYPLIIKNPMDFGTIKSKLENSAYLGVKDFSDDVNLVFSNACTYNQPGSDVFIMAATIKEVFIKKINPILTKHGYPPIPSTPIPSPLAARSLLYQPISPGYNELKKSVDSLKNELRLLKSREQKIVFKVEKDEPIPMTRDEMRKLSNDINKLSDEHLKVIVKIIRQKMNIEDVDEIVIDLDLLDTATLRNLEQYVASTRRKSSNRRRPSRSGQQTASSVESRIELATKTEELTVQKIEDVQKRIAELKEASNARNKLTSSTTIAFTNPIDFAVVSSDGTINNNNLGLNQESESESGSDDSGSDSEEDSSSESESDNSGSDSEPETM